MTKKDIADKISESLGVSHTLTKKIVQEMLDEIILVLSSEKRVELRNFGVFEVKLRRSRKARNLTTGEEVITQARYVVSFKPGKKMGDTVHNTQKKMEKKRKR